MVNDAVSGRYAGVQYVFSGRPDGQAFLVCNGLCETLEVLPTR